MTVDINASPNLPTQLYHYTGIDGLLGMAGSKELWAGNIHYMNDSEELTHALEALHEHAKVKLHQLPPDQSDKAFFLQAIATWASESLHNAKSHHMYIFSLSEEPSLLSQWRSYTPHGKGVCIGFSTKTLIQVCRTNGCSLVKCVYDQAEKAKLFEGMLGGIYNHLYATLPECLNSFNSCLTVLQTSQTENILRILPLIKHQAFSEEREWRFVSKFSYDLSDAEFRPGASMITPYRKWALPDQQWRDAHNFGWLFESIMLGPTPHRELAWASLVAMSHKYNMAQHVDFSDIPYRVW